MKKIYILLVLAFYCCSTSDKNNVSIKELAFKKFVSIQRLVDLPLYFDLDNYYEEGPKSIIVEVSDSLYITDSLFRPADTLFIPKRVVAGRVWGIYKDTSEYFIFITLGEAAYYIPEIEIFDKHGNKIQEEQLLVDGCGADCGYSCNAIARIYKDAQSGGVNFYARDSVFSYECDSNSREVPGSREHYIKFKSGVIDKTGHMTIKTGSLNLLK